MCIVSICEQAAKTFARVTNSASRVLQPTEFTEHLSKLIKMLSMTIEPSELGLDRSMVLTSHSRELLGNTTATYIDLCRNEDCSIGIFIVHPGKKLPLHDHPGMHGVLKCIVGNFHVTSYSAFSDNKDIPLPRSLLNYRGRLQPIPTTPTVTSLGPTSSPLVLTPNDSNFHEIRAVGPGCSAFLDILSPPYHETWDEVRPGERIRDCTYYCVAATEKYEGSDVAWLVEAPEAEIKSFHTRSEPYLGPRI